MTNPRNPPPAPRADTLAAAGIGVVIQDGVTTVTVYADEFALSNLPNRSLYTTAPADHALPDAMEELRLAQTGLKIAMTKIAAYEKRIAELAAEPPAPKAEPIAYLRHGSNEPIQGCPLGAMWISDKNDPRAFPVYAAPLPPSDAEVSS